MPSFNAELACKSLETRINNLERASDSLRKASQGNDGAGARQKQADDKIKGHDDKIKGHEDRIKGHDDRPSKLENVVKVMGENRSASKVDAMEKSIKALHDAKLIDRDTFDKQLQANDAKRGEMYDKQQKEMCREIKADVDKQVEKMQQQIDKANLETRLQTLETKVNMALGKG